MEHLNNVIYFLTKKFSINSEKKKIVQRSFFNFNKIKLLMDNKSEFKKATTHKN